MNPLRALRWLLEVFGLGLLEELADDLVEVLRELGRAVRIALAPRQAEPLP